MNDTTQAAAPARKVRYSIEEAAQILGISPRMLYVRLREKKLRAIRDGRRRFIAPDELRRYARSSQG